MTNSGEEQTKSRSVANAHTHFQATLLVLGVFLFALGVFATTGLPVFDGAIFQSDDTESNDSLASESEDVDDVGSEDASPTNHDDTDNEDRSSSNSRIAGLGSDNETADSLSDQEKTSQTLRLEAIGTDSVEYEVAVSDQVTALDLQTSEQSTVERTRASGEITDEAHSFEFSGDVTNLIVEGDAVVYIDDELVFSTGKGEV